MTPQTWSEMRVKTPWIDALSNKKREEREILSRSAARAGEGKQEAKPDLTPKRMGDSFYRDVSLFWALLS
jgi:hypothetical protein